jgi:hypothetical protein
MAVNVVYYLCRNANYTESVYQNNEEWGSFSEDPKLFSSKEDALSTIETLPNGKYFFTERYIKS